MVIGQSRDFRAVRALEHLWQPKHSGIEPSLLGKARDEDFSVCSMVPNHESPRTLSGSDPAAITGVALPSCEVTNKSEPRSARHQCV